MRPSTYYCEICGAPGNEISPAGWWVCVEHFDATKVEKVYDFKTGLLLSEA